MSEATEIILKKLNQLLSESEEIKKQLAVVPVLETKLTSISQRIKALEATFGVYLDKEAGTDKYKESKSKEKGKEVNTSSYISIDGVAEDRRPPYWDYKPDKETSLWRMLQSQSGKEFLQKILNSKKETDAVKSAQKKIREFYPPAKKLIATLRETNQ